MIIDFHTHYHHYFPGKGPETDGASREEVAERVQQLKELGIDRVCMCGSGGEQGDEHLAKVIEWHPDVFLGLGYVHLGRHGADRVDQVRDRGFAGLKAIGPLVSYADDACFPVYERAQELGMPILFHTGQLSRALKPEPTRYISSGDMQFIHLDRVARAFPELKMVGAHLGVPSFAEAAWVCRMNANVYFDVSGPILLPLKTPGFGHFAVEWIFQAIAAADVLGQLIFGSDNAPAPAEPGERPRRVERWGAGAVLAAYGDLLARFNADDATRAGVFGGRAAKLLGLENGE